MIKLLYALITAVLFLPAISYAQFRGLTAKSPLSEDNIKNYNSHWVISLTPDGDIQRALSEESITPVTGSVGIVASKFIKSANSENITPSVQLGVFFSIESNNSIVEAKFDENQKIINQKAFGSTILLPSTVGCLTEAFEFNLQFYPYLHKARPDDSTFGNFWKKIGFGGFFNSSTMAWKAGDKQELVLHNSGAVYVFNRILEAETSQDDPNNKFILAPYFGYTFRNINGEIRNNDEFRYKLLGTKDTWFHGVEPGLQLVVNSLRTNISVPLFFRNNIDGLSFGQVMITFGVSGNIVLAKKFSAPAY